jgi:sec-independent protein translocase protein TatB
LGPDKLPEVMINIAKFFKTVKKNLTEAKDALDKELETERLKEELQRYKEQANVKSLIEDKTKDIKDSFSSESREVSDIFSDLKKDN